MSLRVMVRVMVMVRLTGGDVGGLTVGTTIIGRVTG